jgi:hypothetical protein
VFVAVFEAEAGFAANNAAKSALGFEPETHMTAFPANIAAFSAMRRFPHGEMPGLPRNTHRHGVILHITVHLLIPIRPSQ